jgi:hypothetical protein
MKIIIISDNTCINTIISKSIKVKELLSNLKKSLPDFFKTDSFLVDEKGIMSEEDTIVLNQEVKTLFIIHKLVKKLSSTEKIPIEDLISQATGATTKLKVNKLKRTGPMIDRVSILEQMMNNTVSSFNSNNVGSRTAQLNQIQSLLRTLMEQPAELIPQSRPVTQNVVADENLVNNLKEMGFPEDRCRRALIMCRNNINRATDMLLNDAMDYIPER